MEKLMVMLNVAIGLSFLSFIFFVCEIYRYKRKQKEIYEKERSEREAKLQEDLRILKTTLVQVEKEIKEKETFNNSLLQMREEEMNRLIEAKRAEKEKQLKLLIEKREAETNQEIAKIDEYYGEVIADYEKSIADFEQRQNAINEAIQREKLIQNNEDFYRIQVPQSDQEDIAVLRELIPRLRNKEILNKLIYTSFIQRPLQEMEKRVLGGEKFSGIYKITYLKTGEAYIGKSTDISGRWIEHIKSSFDIGSIAHSSFHTRLAKDGIWNYSFEVLEKVPKDKLSEREKYYIDLYQTDKIGLNMKGGG